MTFRNGLTAGFVATVIVSIAMRLMPALGVPADLDTVSMAARAVATLTQSVPNPLVGWTVHLVVGTVLWGGLYSMVESSLPGPPVVRGTVFAVGAWLAMMIAVLPLVGIGFFGSLGGASPAIVLLVLHVVFGAALGVTYAKMRGGAARDDVVPR
jgi:hypothetical protein